MLTQADPPAEATHWTATMMAKAVGFSASSVQRIWRANGLRPHRVQQFKLSNDPKFIDKLRDVVGLYVNPPAHAIVLSVDEKSQIQALDRAQPGLPMKKGRAGTMTHEYKRHGTTTLFAALDVLLRPLAGNSNRAPLSLSKGIERIEDLRGKRIGTTSLTEGAAVMVQKMLAAHGCTPVRAISAPTRPPLAHRGPARGIPRRRRRTQDRHGCNWRHGAA
jgi:hypothetical protein